MVEPLIGFSLVVCSAESKPEYAKKFDVPLYMFNEFFLVQGRHKGQYNTYNIGRRGNRTWDLMYPGPQS